jgi:hypothetical protein
VFGERLGFGQLLEGAATRLRVAASSRAELLVSLVQVLRELLDDLGLARRAQPQPGEMRAQMSTGLSMVLRVADRQA